MVRDGTQIKIITVVLAFASLIYEFTLSHIMSILYGGLVSQYILTIGLYIFGLGVGSLYFERYSEKIKLSVVEILLTILGSLSIVIPLYLYKYVPYSHFFSLVYVFLIAFLSGIELPALMKGQNSYLSILGLDYLGMALAGLFFPLILLPLLGLKLGLILTASLNFLCVILLFEKFPYKKTSSILTLSLLISSFLFFDMQEILL